MKFDDDSKQSLILPPLPNSPPRKYPTGKVIVSKVILKLKKWRGRKMIITECYEFEFPNCK